MSSVAMPVRRTRSDNNKHDSSNQSGNHKPNSHRTKKKRKDPLFLFWVVAIAIAMYLLLSGVVLSTMMVVDHVDISDLSAGFPTTVKASSQITAKKDSFLVKQQEVVAAHSKLLPRELNLKTPIIVMGLQKAGTTSIYSYFKCGMDGALSHYDCKPILGKPEKIGMPCGKRLRRNIEILQKPAFDGIDHFDLYAELDALRDNGGITLPQWNFVQQIYDYFPNATWILNLRDPQAWLRSVDRWQDLRQRFVDHLGGVDFPRGRGAKDEEMIAFYKLQAQRIRDYVKDHPSITLVEVQIDSPEAEQVMEDSFGIHRKCWGNKNKNSNNETATVWVPKNPPPHKSKKLTQTTYNESEQQDKKLKPHELTLSTPILVMGLQKAGTTSIYSYFKCGMDGALSHYDCKPDPRRPGEIGMACGKRLRRNIEKFQKPAFDEIDHFDLYAELDAQENNGGITLPQWNFVQQMHDHFPNATWILNLRDPQAWLRSVDRWQDLRQRFIGYLGGVDFPKGRGAKDEEMVAFYKVQAQRIRDFVKDHPSITLVEVQIDSPEAGQVMEDAFGISKKCWGNKNANNGAAFWTED